MSKVAILSLPFPEEVADSIKAIYNLDMTEYAQFEYDNETEDIKCDSLKDDIIAYYPSWDFICFFCDDYNTDFIRIRIGESWKLINKKLIYDILDLPTFLYSAEFYPKETDEFFMEDHTTKILHDNKRALECKIINVEGDWIMVQDGVFKAWVKWKNGSKVLPDRLRFDI